MHDTIYRYGNDLRRLQFPCRKAVSKVPGVQSCSVSLLTNSMGVEGTASTADIIAAVKHAGYGAIVKGAAKNVRAQGAAADDEELLKDHETPLLKKRLISSLIFGLFLCICRWDT